MTTRHAVFAAAFAFVAASPVAAQGPSDDARPADAAPAAVVEESTPNTAPEITIQYMRPADQRGLNVFEAPKDDGVDFAGFRMDWSAAFTQQFQALSHDNAATPNPDGAGVDRGVGLYSARPWPSRGPSSSASSRF